MRHGETQVRPVSSGPDRLGEGGHEDRHIDPPRLQTTTVGWRAWPWKKTLGARSSEAARWGTTASSETEWCRLNQFRQSSGCLGKFAPVAATGLPTGPPGWMVLSLGLAGDRPKQSLTRSRVGEARSRGCQLVGTEKVCTLGELDRLLRVCVLGMLVVVFGYRLQQPQSRQIRSLASGGGATNKCRERIDAPEEDAGTSGVTGR